MYTRIVSVVVVSNRPDVALSSLYFLKGALLFVGNGYSYSSTFKSGALEDTRRAVIYT